MSAITLLQGDCLQVLATLPDESVQTCVTSPPYFGLRDYQTASWEGGDERCDHQISDEEFERQYRSRSGLAGAAGGVRSAANSRWSNDGCPRCGARRIDSQIGLEGTPDAYVAKMVAVFREVRRVLRDDGTVWLNLGDSYTANGSGGNTATRQGLVGGKLENPTAQGFGKIVRTIPNGLKPKDLLGIPWRVAFALQADGWYLRQDIIWHKPNPMPESVTDRCTKAHEYIFLLTKSATYYYDHEAIKEKGSGRVPGNKIPQRLDSSHNGEALRILTAQQLPQEARNKRSVWTVTTKPFKGAHFATFPPDLIEPCILAGAPERCCSECGAPWVRVVERERTGRGATSSQLEDGIHARSSSLSLAQKRQAYRALGSEGPPPVRTISFQPTCTCNAGVIGGVVLDPFNGAGTTGVVAIQHGRRYIGIELNPDYLEMSRKRIQAKRDSLTAPMFVASHAIGAR